MKATGWKLAVAALAALAVSAVTPSLSHAEDAKIPGVSFNGGDGSYKKAVEEGITLAIANDAPYTYQDDKTKEYDGVDVRIFKDLMKRLGIEKITWTIVPFDSLIPGLQAKRWDVIVDNLHENPKRLAVVSFTSPAYWYGTGIAVQKGNPAGIKGWEDFAGKNIGAVRGSFIQPILEKRKEIKELKLYQTNDAQFADLAAGRLDAVVDDDFKINQFIAKNAGVNMEPVTGFMPVSDEYGYARYTLRKDDVDLNHAISRALDEARGDGSVGAVLKDFNLGDRNLWYFPVK